MTATANTYSAWVRTRYAPTPSGYLHLGNAVHFTLTAALGITFPFNLLAGIPLYHRIAMAVR